MTKFRELSVGDTFDFISPNRMLNSYYERCVKTGARTYVPVEGEDAPVAMRVGTINVEVFHVEKAKPRWAGLTIDEQMEDWMNRGGTNE